jgi:hypothetical protein
MLPLAVPPGVIGNGQIYDLSTHNASGRRAAASSTSVMSSSLGRRPVTMDLVHEDDEGGHGSWTGREEGGTRMAWPNAVVVRLQLALWSRI